MTYRLAPQPGEVILRDERFSFTWNGAAFPAFAGDTIASALAACGVRVFSRSDKYHRPHGILTADYLDPCCTVQVGDEPNVRGAHRLVNDGMNVRAQNAWPSLRFDLKSANRLMARFMGPGFYYKTFIFTSGSSGASLRGEKSIRTLNMVTTISGMRARMSSSPAAVPPAWQPPLRRQTPVRK
jgi:hypothetical protein